MFKILFLSLSDYFSFVSSSVMLISLQICDIASEIPSSIIKSSLDSGHYAQPKIPRMILKLLLFCSLFLYSAFVHHLGFNLTLYLFEVCFC